MRSSPVAGAPRAETVAIRVVAAVAAVALVDDARAADVIRLGHRGARRPRASPPRAAQVLSGRGAVAARAARAAAARAGRAVARAGRAVARDGRAAAARAGRAPAAAPQTAVAALAARHVATTGDAGPARLAG